MWKFCLFCLSPTWRTQTWWRWCVVFIFIPRNTRECVFLAKVSSNFQSAQRNSIFIISIFFFPRLLNGHRCLFSYQHISQLISSLSITRTKCALKSRCMTRMLIRLALRSLRSAPQRAGSAAGSRESSAGWWWGGGGGGARDLHSSEKIFVSVSERPGMCAGCQIHPCQSSLNHLSWGWSWKKWEGWANCCCNRTGNVPSLITSSG